MGVVTSSPPGFPGATFSRYATPLAIPAAGRPWIVPKGNWMIAPSGTDHVEIITSTGTIALSAAGVGVPYVAADGTNVQVNGTGGAGTAIQVLGT